MQLGLYFLLVVQDALLLDQQLVRLRLGFFQFLLQDSVLLDRDSQNVGLVLKQFSELLGIVQVTQRVHALQEVAVFLHLSEQFHCRVNVVAARANQDLLALVQAMHVLFDDLSLKGLLDHVEQHCLLKFVLLTLFASGRQRRRGFLGSFQGDVRVFGLPQVVDFFLLEGRVHGLGYVVDLLLLNGALEELVLSLFAEELRG